MALAERFGGGAGGTIFNAFSMGGEAMLEAKEKGWSDSAAMEMFAVNMGFGAIGGRVIARSLNRINGLTGGALSKYILSLASDNAPALLPAARAGVAAGQSALEGGLFGAAQSFGSEAWAKLRNLGDAGQREWSVIWNDAKTAGVQSALTMALTTIFAAGAVPRAQRQQLTGQPENGTPPSPSEAPSQSPEPPALSPLLKSGPETPPPTAKASEPAAPAAEPKQDNTPTEPTAPSDPPVNPLAERVADLHDQATILRNQITAAHGDGTPEAIGKLAANLDAEKDTHAQFHQATQDLLDTVPEDIRSRIEEYVAPGLDHNSIRARNQEDPTHSFATAEIGSALRDQYLPDQAQRAIRKFALAGGVDPALADRLADQAVGARTVRDLGAVLRGEPIDPRKATQLKKLGLLKPARMSDGMRPLAITDDVLPLLPKSMQDDAAVNPKALRVVHTKGPPADGLNRLVDAGRQRFADTAKGIVDPKAPIVAPIESPSADTNPAEVTSKTPRFQLHHIISPTNIATRAHRLIKLAGINLESAFNKIYLPEDPSLHPSLSIHKGRHFQSVSDELSLKMDDAVTRGEQEGWTRAEYAEALRGIITANASYCYPGNAP